MPESTDSIGESDEISAQYSAVSSAGYSSILGVGSAFAGALLSALGGTYIEYVMKSDAMQGMKPQSLAFKNLQLAFFSLFFATAVCFAKDGDEIQNRGFFAAYDSFVM